MAEPGAVDFERKSLVERALSVFTEVRAGEGAGLLLLALNAFVLLLAYYLVKTVREGLILTESGAEVKAYASGAQALLFLAIVPAYAAFASRVNRIRLITWVTLFFVSNLAVFYGFGMSGAREGVVFFIWVGVFNMLIISQFWAFANDLYSEPQGKRLFPAIMLGASLGGLAGGQAAARFIKFANPSSGSYDLMLITAILLVGCILISRAINHRASGDRVHFVPAPEDVPLGKTSPMELLMRDRYLLLIAVVMVVLNCVNSLGEFMFGKLVTAEAVRIVGSSAAAQKAFITAYYGYYSNFYNGLGLFLQMFAVSRIFRYLGVRAAVFILPCIALTGYSFILFLPLLAVVQWVKVFENGTDYSIQNTTRQALFLPTSREAKYKAKAAIDTFFVRSGDVVQAGIVYLGSSAKLGLKGFAIINIILTVAWLAVAWAIAREYGRRTQPQTSPVPIVAAGAGTK
jgi:AAA family ATP:ADP antiporter